MAKKRIKHKTLGEYKYCKVIPRLQFEHGSMGFVGINLYEAEFRFEVPVCLPEKAIQAIEKATYEEHFWNKDYEHDDGKKGRHETRPVECYIVVRLPDLDAKAKAEREEVSNKNVEEVELKEGEIL